MSVIKKLIILMLGTVSACSTTANRDSAYQMPLDLAAAAGWRDRIIETSHFSLRSWSPMRERAARDPLYVYIETDGTAFRHRFQANNDPTPERPNMLAMALKDTRHNAVYLARPCQYVIRLGKGGNCHVTSVWTNGRFHEDIVDNMNQALDQVKRKAGAHKLVLVGVSGGGSIATLLAARRGDVAALVTFAAVLDHRAWTSKNGFSPLRQSLNPIDYADKLAGLPQWHFGGGKDDIVSAALIEQASRKLQGQFVLIPAADHDCCWAPVWMEFQKKLDQRF